MKFLANFIAVIILALSLDLYVQSYDITRGAQIRLTTKCLNYAASIGVKELQKELTNKQIPTESGKEKGIDWRASNILINYLRIGNYRVIPLANTGLRLSVSSVTTSISGRVRVGYKKGWFKVSDSTNVKIKGSNIGFTLDFKFDARSGKPYVQATSCSANIGNLNLDFDGGLSWVYNTISSVFSGKLKDVIKKAVCTAGTKVINKEANNFFAKFPVQQNIEDIAIIDYSFQRPVVTSSYLDLLLRGEFLNPKNPRHGSETPPTFDTITSSSKMVYVWLSDYTLNSAGRVMHETGLLKKLVNPLMNDIPAEVRPFLNTNTFAQYIPELARRFPNRPLEFQIATNKAPEFQIEAGSIKVLFNVRATIVVDKVDGSKLPVFYIDLTVASSGSVFVKSVNKQLNVGGNIVDFTFGAKIGGSVLGDINIPLDDPSIKQLVHGLVVANANPLLNKGFPIPKIEDLDFVNPQVSFVKDAIRIDSDIAYNG